MKRVTRGIELLQRSTDSLAERWSRRGKSRAARFHRNEMVFVSRAVKMCIIIHAFHVVSICVYVWGGGEERRREKRKKEEKKEEERERKREGGRENLIYSKVNRLYRRIIFSRGRFVCLYVELGRIRTERYGRWVDAAIRNDRPS